MKLPGDAESFSRDALPWAEDDGACTHLGTSLVRLTGTVWRCQCGALVAIEPEETAADAGR